MNKWILAFSIASVSSQPAFVNAAEIENTTTNAEKVEATEVPQEINATAKKEPKVAGFYLGGTLGQAKQRILFDDDWHDTTHKSSDEKTAFRLLGGYQFNRIIGIEADYTDYGNYDFTKPTAFALQANLGYTFHNGLRIFTLQGLSKIDLHNKENTLFKDETSTAWRTGLGIEFAPRSLNGLAFRAAMTYDITTLQSTDNLGVFDNWMLLRNYSIGATYKF